MASSLQWNAARNWRLAGDAEIGWDEWYHKVEHIIQVQDAYIDSLQEDIRKIRHDVRTLTATMTAMANTLSSSSTASNSRLPNPSTAVEHWPLAVPAEAWDRSHGHAGEQPQRPCEHGMEDQFRFPFTVADHSEFHAYHDQNEMAWRDLQSLASKNNMLSGLLETRFKKCDGLRIQRYGKKTQTVRLACTHCRCCTGEIVARKADDHGGTIQSESSDDIAFFWRWLFSVLLRDPSLQQPAIAATPQPPLPVFPNHFTMAPSFPPPPSTPPGNNISVHLPIAAAPPPAPVPLEAREVPISSTPSPPAPAPLVPLQEPVEADIVEVPLTPALEVPVISTYKADKDWNTL